MIVCEHYQTYHGPPLIDATLDGKEITEQIKEKYGTEYNWQGYLWTYKEVFGEESYGKHFCLNFKGNDEKNNSFYGYINDINQYFNIPLHTPTNQI